MTGEKRSLGTLLEHSRLEVIPTKDVADAVVQWVPRDVLLTVTASPVKGLDATLALTRRLVGEGYRVVPHISARLVADLSELEKVSAELVALGIDDIFVPAGDADPPVGPFDSALAMLQALKSLGNPFPSVGVTGYPETHPKITDDVTIQAMWDKRQYATYIVSNLCFDHATIRRWIERVRNRGVTLPLYIGIAAPIDRAKLFDVATKIGVGESAKFLTRHAEWFLRMGAPGGYNPVRLLQRLNRTLIAEESGIAGLHIFSFNQISKTEEWRQAQLARFGLAQSGSAPHQAAQA